MFQGWILFLNEIYSDLIKLEVPIFAILAGLVTAFVTVWLERRKDQKEKLQDRKDMWLKDHWKDLAIYLENISEFGLREDKPREEPKATTLGPAEEYHPGYQELGTALCGYNLIDGIFRSYCHIDLFKKRHIRSLSHIESGYKELNDLLEGIFSDEKKYYKEMSESLNDIYLDITNCMKKNFPQLKILIDSTKRPRMRNIPSGEEGYKINSFFSELIDKIKNGSYELSEVIINERYCVEVESKERASSTITSSKESILTKFEKEIWSKLITKYEKTVKELQINQEKIVKKELCWNKGIKKIIDYYNIGFSIKGKCKDCEKILSEKKIINIRPPEINK